MIKKFLFFPLFVSLACISILPAHFVLADEAGGTFSGGIPNPLGSNTTLISIITKIFEWLVKISAIIVPIIIVIGAFMMIFAAGDPARFRKGMHAILFAVIGFVIILLAWGVSDILKNVLTQ